MSGGRLGDGDGVQGVRRIRVLGVPVDVVGPVEVRGLVAGAVREGRPYRVLVANANKAWLAARDPGVRAALEGAELVVAEWGVAWAAARLGYGLVPWVRGVALMRELLVEGSRNGWSVYLLGGEPGVASALARKLEVELPGLRVCGFHHGYLDGAEDRAVRGVLAEVRPDLLFVAMGSPRQERWIGSLPADGGPLVRMGVGGSFDVLLGRRREAPRWMQGRGLEWIYRTVQEPGRLGRRYLVVNSWLIGAVLRERVRRWVRG